MAPASEATCAASAATAISAGSGDRGPEAETEREGEQRRGAPLARKPLRDRLAEREETALQALDEERQARDHAEQTDQDAPDVRKRLLQHHDLEEGDDGDDGREITQGVCDATRQNDQGLGHPASVTVQPSGTR